MVILIIIFLSFCPEQKKKFAPYQDFPEEVCFLGWQISHGGLVEVRMVGEERERGLGSYVCLIVQGQRVGRRLSHPARAPPLPSASVFLSTFNRSHLPSHTRTHSHTHTLIINNEFAPPPLQKRAQHRPHERPRHVPFLLFSGSRLLHSLLSIAAEACGIKTIEYTYIQQPC